MQSLSNMDNQSDLVIQTVKQMIQVLIDNKQHSPSKFYINKTSNSLLLTFVKWNYRNYTFFLFLAVLSAT